LDRLLGQKVAKDFVPWNSYQRWTYNRTDWYINVGEFGSFLTSTLVMVMEVLSETLVFDSALTWMNIREHFIVFKLSSVIDSILKSNLGNNMCKELTGVVFLDK
jgi:hypothetical protein